MFEKIYLATHKELPTITELDVTELELYNLNTSISQLVWRKMKIGNSSEEQFKQEFPSNAIEAFLTTGKNVFNSSMLHDKINSTHLQDLRIQM